MPSIGGFLGGADGKESACNAGDLGLVAGWGRFPWRRKWQPIPIFSPGNPMDRIQSMGSQRVQHD